MELTWSLDALYQGFNDPQFSADQHELETLIQKLPEALAAAKQQPAKEALITLLTALENEAALAYRLQNYLSLCQSADAADPAAASASASAAVFASSTASSIIAMISSYTVGVGLSG